MPIHTMWSAYSSSCRRLLPDVQHLVIAVQKTPPRVCQDSRIWALTGGWTDILVSLCQMESWKPQTGPCVSGHGGGCFRQYHCQFKRFLENWHFIMRSYYSHTYKINKRWLFFVVVLYLTFFWLNSTIVCRASPTSLSLPWKIKANSLLQKISGINKYKQRSQETSKWIAEMKQI